MEEKRKETEHLRKENMEALNTIQTLKQQVSHLQHELQQLRLQQNTLVSGRDMKGGEMSQQVAGHEVRVCL